MRTQLPTAERVSRSPWSRFLPILRQYHCMHTAAEGEAEGKACGMCFTAPEDDVPANPADLPASCNSSPGTASFWVH